MTALADENKNYEYSDDPTRLFDFEYDRVHFGTLLKENGNTHKDQSHLWNDNSAHGNDDNAERSSVDELNNFSVSDCLPLSIELVDCAKFPWYFRKYTEQIINKLEIIDIVSDSDEEMSSKHIEDDDDCIIIDEITGKDNDDCIIIDEIVINNEPQKMNNNIGNDFQTRLPIKSITETSIVKKKETTSEKPRVKLGLPRALNQRKIDFKRNKGLIGLKVLGLDDKTKNTTFEEAKEKDIEIDEFVRATCKVLNQCGTEVIPITNNVVTQATLRTSEEIILSKKSIDIEKNNNENKSSLNSKKATANFVGYSIKNKTINKTSHEADKTDKLKKCKHPSKPRSVSKKTHCIKSPTLSTISRNQIKIINKTFDKQIKALQKMISELLELQKSKEKLTNKSNETKTHNHENFAEIHSFDESQKTYSPILPCSTTMNKNNNLGEISPKEKSTIKSIRSGVILKEKSENIFNNCNDKQVLEIPKHEKNDIFEMCDRNDINQTYSSSNQNTTQSISNAVSLPQKVSNNKPAQVALPRIYPDKLFELKTDAKKTPSSNAIISQKKSRDTTINNIEALPNIAVAPSCQPYQGLSNDLSQKTNRSKSNTNTPLYNSQAIDILNNPQNTDQSTNNLKRKNNEVVKEKLFQVGSFKRSKFPTNLDIVPDVTDCKQIVQQKGYSPPILPIPTYVNIIGQAGLDLRKKNCFGKNVKIRNVDTSCNSILNKQLPETIKKGPSKRITLEEYRKRTLDKKKNDNVSKFVSEGNKNMRQPKIQNNLRENVDRFSTDSDLGYSSDSTVIL